MERTYKVLCSRVQGVKGIFEAHKRCAELAYTKSFYVVDADAKLESNFDFPFKPKWDEHCVPCMEMESH